MEGQSEKVHLLVTIKQIFFFFETAPVCVAVCSQGHSSPVAANPVVPRRALLGRSTAYVTLEKSIQHYVSSISTDECVKFILIHGTLRESLQCQIQYSAIWS